MLQPDSDVGWVEQSDTHQSEDGPQSHGYRKERIPPDDGNYIFTNLPKYNDLKPGQKVVEEALAQSGKK